MTSSSTDRGILLPRAFAMQSTLSRPVCGPLLSAGCHLPSWTTKSSETSLKLRMELPAFFLIARL